MTDQEMNALCEEVAKRLRLQNHQVTMNMVPTAELREFMADAIAKSTAIPPPQPPDKTKVYEARLFNVSAGILAGFASNPAIFASNANCGWSLVNDTLEGLAQLSIALADAHLAEYSKEIGRKEAASHE